jgi:hypothetical protein
MSATSTKHHKKEKGPASDTKWNQLPSLIRRVLETEAGAKLMVVMRSVERAAYIERMREMDKYKEAATDKIPPSKKTYPNSLQRLLDCLGLVWLKKWGSIQNSIIGEALKPASTTSAQRQSALRCASFRSFFFS